MTIPAGLIAWLSMTGEGVAVAAAADAAPDGGEVMAASVLEGPGGERGEGRSIHRGKGSLALLPGVGYRTIVPYEEHKDCGDRSGVASKRLCASRAPAFVDLQLAHGTFAATDLLVDLRVGVESDFTGSHQLAVAPGLRRWLDPAARTRGFTVFQVVLDWTRQNSRGVSDVDLGARFALGFMHDLSERLGLFLQSGTTLGLLRWLRLEVDLGLGAQVRWR